MIQPVMSQHSYEGGTLMSEPKTYKNLINGQWVDSATGRTFENRNPADTRDIVGVFGLSTPWIFPMAIPSWKILPALSVGNTVVIKPASDTPLSVLNLVQCLVDAGLPEGAVNIVTGGGSKVGEPLMRHPDVKVIS